MDDRKHSISLDALHARFRSEAAPILVDVRVRCRFCRADALATEAFHRSPDAFPGRRRRAQARPRAVDCRRQDRERQ